MGIMSCSRKKCENIMCDVYVKGYGYICNECKRELEKIEPSSEMDVINFLKTPKSSDFLDDKGKFSIDRMFEFV